METKSALLQEFFTFDVQFKTDETSGILWATWENYKNPSPNLTGKIFWFAYTNPDKTMIFIKYSTVPVAKYGILDKIYLLPLQGCALENFKTKVFDVWKA